MTAGMGTSELARGVLWRTLVALVVALSALSLAHWVRPTLGPARYAYDGKDAHPGAMPLSIESAGRMLHVHTTVQVHGLHPRLFSLVPDDCLRGVAVNGEAVAFDGPICLGGGGRVWLGGHLHAGDNDLDAVVDDHGGLGGLRLGVSILDPLLLSLLAIAAAALVGWAVSMATWLESRRTGLVVLAVIVATVAARSPWLFERGYEYDVGLIMRWSRSAVELGVARSYLEQVDHDMLPNYPPLSMLVFAATGHAYRWLISAPFDVAMPDCLAIMKLPTLMADGVTGVLMFFVVRTLRAGRSGAALLAALVYAVHPAVIFDSMVWGQVDGQFTALVVATLAAVLARRWVLVGALTALALATKVQAFVMLPTVVILGLVDAGAWKRALPAAGVATLLVLTPFLHGPVLRAIAGVYVHSAGFYPLLSLHAYNLWVALCGLAERNRPDATVLFGVASYRAIGLTLFAVSALGITLAGLRSMRQAPQDPRCGAAILVVPALTTYAFFLFNTEMHERYLFPVMSLALPLAVSCRSGAAAYAATSALFLLNMLGVLPWTAVDRALYATLPQLPAFVGACHTFAFGCAVALVLRLSRRRWRGRQRYRTG